MDVLGDIILFAGPYVIKGYAECDGQLLPIDANRNLFSLLGTTYGGDGKTTFALPKKQLPKMGQSLSGYGKYLICINPSATIPTRG